MSATAVVECPPLLDLLFDRDVVKRTVKISNCNYSGSVSVNDVVELFKLLKIPPSDVETMARGFSDKEVSVVFKSLLPLKSLLQHDVYKIQQKSLRVISSGQQITTVRVHWLPVFASDAMVAALLKPYGKVISVHNGNININDFNFKSGIRIVKMEVDEVEKRNIPHLLKFQCGNRALLTIQGRPPLCLKCHQVGHYRNACSGDTNISDIYFKMQKSFADAGDSRKEEQLRSELNDMSEELAKSGENVKETNEMNKDEEQEKESDKEDENNKEEEMNQESQEPNSGKKRDRDEDEDEEEAFQQVECSFKKFFPAQKSKVSSVEPSEVRVSNSYAALLDETPDLVIDEPRSESGGSDGAMDDSLDLND